MANTCGIDWSERHHDVAIVNHDGAMVARARVSHDITGFGQLVELLAEHAAEPTAIEIAIESDKGLLVAALRAAGFVVFAINPRAVARYRVRYGQAGGKSDPGDAVVLANILRTDRHATAGCRPTPTSPPRSRPRPASTRRRSGRASRR